eukprot:gene17827-9517_t
MADHELASFDGSEAVPQIVSPTASSSEDCANNSDASFPDGAIDSDYELDEVVTECREIIESAGASRWSERQTASHAKWEENRESVTEAMLKEQFLSESLCCYCKQAPPYISCRHCRSVGPVCGSCDLQLHRRQPFHDRMVWKNGTFEFIPPLQSVNDAGKITEIGRYDLLKQNFCCGDCMADIDPFSPTTLMESHYWPGSISNITYLFDEELLVFWDRLKSFMPGTSEAAFLKSLEHLSKERSRQSTINKTAFSKCFKEWKYCSMQFEEMQMKSLFECPSCSVEQHASHVDGNCKLYRYKGSGERKRPSYYGDLFICNNEEVDNALQTIYDNPDISRMPEIESGLCGSTLWKAAQERSRKFAKLDETGIVMISCRHRIAQKALNMFRGELFGYSYYLQKNFLAERGLTMLYTDVACKYSKWVQKNDPELHRMTNFAIGMMHVKGHPAHCEVLFGGLWTDGAGFTSGEEDEQIFSYLSRIGTTTKYMLPERREETITEHAAAWNRRKLDNFVPDLHKRYSDILRKRVEVKQDIKKQLAKCNVTVTAETYQNWKDEAILNAEVAQNSLLSVSISDDQELVMLYMLLKEKDQLPDNMEHVCDTEAVVPLKIAALRLKPFAKSHAALQKKYVNLNEKFASSQSIIHDGLDNTYEKVFLLHQRRLEATAYTIIHLTNSLSRIADSSKKRKKIRVKVSKQSELLKTLVSIYNENARRDVIANLPRISLMSCLQDSFPWRQMPSDEMNVTSELKQTLLVLNLTLKRLNEELSLIELEMKNFISFFKEKKMKDLQKRLKELSDSFAGNCEHGIPDIHEDNNAKYTTSKKTDDVLRGKIALVHQGLHYCRKQVVSACNTFGPYIGKTAAQGTAGNDHDNTLQVEADLGNDWSDLSGDESSADTSDFPALSDISSSNSDTDGLN